MILFQNMFFFYYYFCQQVIFYLIHSGCRVIFVLFVQKITFGHTVATKKNYGERGKQDEFNKVVESKEKNIESEAGDVEKDAKSMEFLAGV